MPRSLWRDTDSSNAQVRTTTTSAVILAQEHVSSGRCSPLIFLQSVADTVVRVHQLFASTMQAPAHARLRVQLSLAGHGPNRRAQTCAEHKGNMSSRHGPCYAKTSFDVHHRRASWGFNMVWARGPCEALAHFDVVSLPWRFR